MYNSMNSNIEKIQGHSILPKSFSFLSEYRDLLQLSFKDPFYEFDSGHKEKDWENIPFVIPKCIVVLEKKFSALQGWCKYKDKEIDKLLSNEFFKKLRDEIDADKKSDANYKRDMENKVTELTKRLDHIVYENEIKKRDKKHPDPSIQFCDKFFPLKDSRVNLYENSGFKMTAEAEGDPEYIELRKYSMQQLRHMTYSLLNRSDFKYKLLDLEEKVKDSERRILDLYSKRETMDKKIDQHQKERKEEMEKDSEKMLEFIQEEVLKKVEQQKKLLDTTLEEFEDLKKDIEENKGYREALNQKIDKMISRANSFYSAFETRLSQLNEELKVSTSGLNAKLSGYEDNLKKDIAEIIKAFEEESEKSKEAFLNRIDEINRVNLVNMEDFKNNLTKIFHVLSFDTKKALENYKDDVSRHTTVVNEKVNGLDIKIQGFIERFDDYSRTKIEPAFHNQAKIHIIESRLKDLEQYHSTDSHFVRSVVKKLIFALQKFNLSVLKNSQEGDESLPHGFHNSLSEITPSLPSQSPDLTTNMIFPAMNTTVNSGFKIRSRTAVRTSRGPSGPNIGVEGKSALNQTMYIPNERPKSKMKDENAGAGALNLVAGSEEFTLQNPKIIVTGALGSGMSSIMVPEQKDRLGFDAMLHKRLEHLRKMLVDDEKQMSIGGAEKLDSKKEALKAYKDLRLIKVGEEGVKKKRNKSLNITAPIVNEFADDHLGQKND